MQRDEFYSNDWDGEPTKSYSDFSATDVLFDHLNVTVEFYRQHRASYGTVGLFLPDLPCPLPELLAGRSHTIGAVPTSEIFEAETVKIDVSVTDGGK